MLLLLLSMLLLFLLLFIPLFLITFYIPGRYILRISNVYAKDAVSHITLSLGLGIAIFLFTIYSLSWVHLVSFYYLFIAYCLLREGLSVLDNIQQYSWKKLSFNKNILLIFLGSIITTALVWSSGLMTSHGMELYGVNAIDGIVHMSLINQFIDQFPAMTPYLSGIPFRGYHFFYDFMIANFAILFPFFLFQIYFFAFFLCF
jgi:hypothetical protein